MDSFNITTVVESMVKKNRNRFPIAVFLTTLICSHQTTVNLFFWVYDCNFEIMGACNTPLERYLQDLSSGILETPKILKFQLVN
jgi:hypothetical protein